MKTQNAVNKKGFTLMELLIVVVIIGMLVSIALPTYRKAVEKSKASDALTAMQAVAKSEHELYLVKNKYTKDFTDLDIDLTGEIDEEKLKTTYYNYELLDRGILATRTNKEYSLYKDYEIAQIMCAPSEHYICENLGGFTKEPCQEAKFAWANRNSTCYGTNKARCEGLYGDSIWNGTFCGYINTKNKTIDEGVICEATLKNGCSGSVIKSGGVCHATAAEAFACNDVTIKDGGVCNAEGTGVYGGGCADAKIESGGVCNAKSSGPWTCYRVTIKSGGVCNAIGYDTCNGVKIEAGGICNAQASRACNSATVYSGAVCKGTTVNACVGSTIKEGGECWAEAEGACSSQTSLWERNMTYEGSGATSGCCRGKYCPSGSPRCECENHETACDAAPTV